MKKNFGKMSENILAEDVGGKRIPGSGNGIEKGDISVKEGVLKGFLMENKARHGGVTITPKLLRKLKLEAVQSGQEPAFSIDLIDEISREQWIAVPRKRFINLLESESRSVSRDQFDQALN